MITPDRFLARARIKKDEQRYVVGAFDSNITMYRQQIRALNLVYALAEGATGLPRGKKIAIIGAGALGVTAAVAAASIGYEVELYEKHQMILPMQRGCDTRWINPRFYEWPDVGSDARYADLPLMAWESGTADQVADQLWRGFDRYRATTGRIELYVQVNNLSVDKVGDSYVVECDHQDGGDSRESMKVDAVLYAVGFGVEADYQQKSPSYWHNDNLGQLELREDTRTYLLSGIGDGGLTDLARLRIRRFRHELIFQELFDNPPEALLERLRLLRDVPTGAPDDWLFEQFQAIKRDAACRDAFKAIKERVRLRLRTDTIVIVNSREPAFRDALNLHKVSVANALVAFILNELRAFTYKPGKLELFGDHWVLEESGGKRVPVDAATTVVVRHGTSSVRALASVGVALPSHKKKEFVGSDQPIYGIGWWGSNQMPGLGATPTVANAVEFVAPAAVVLATGFVSTVADVLVQRHLAAAKTKEGDTRPSEPPRFRLTIHRVIRAGDESFFQQLSPYSGLPKDQDPEGGVGRVFRVRAGIGGLAIRTGEPVSFKRPRDQESLALMERLTSFEELKARPIEPHVDSIFACPFFAGDDGRVVFMLFADSSELNFFNSDALGTLYAACRGFVKNIDAALASGRLSQTRGVNVGHLVEQPHGLDADALAAAGIKLGKKAFADFKKDLTFSTLASTELDIIDRVRHP